MALVAKLLELVEPLASASVELVWVELKPVELEPAATELLT